MRLFASNYRRTCQECGSTWIVAKALVRPTWWPSGSLKPPSAGFSFGQGPEAGSSLQSARGQEWRAAVENRAELVSSLSHCPKCGSEHYTQRSER